MDLAFRLNGKTVELQDVQPTTTLLDWLRDTQRLTGTKEGCNEGDCGACTVMVTDENGAKALNACILFLPQLQGKAIRTVEGIAAPDGTPHPVQSAMVEHHGSQCGFCTPGFITSMATAHLNSETDHDTALAGNLCRCTGYAPIIKAARAAQAQPIPSHVDDSALLWSEKFSEEAAQPKGADSPPTTLDDFANWYDAHPDTTLIAGATDVGLWVTKQMRDLGQVAFLNRVPELAHVQETDTSLYVGAMTTLSALDSLIAPHYPSFSAMIQRYGSRQVRNAATIGGNIANGSPIGDGPPALIALGATLHLQKAEHKRSIPLEDFFLEYGKQNRAPGELVTGISIPKAPDRLKCYKLSKRFDQDISAVCGCVWIEVNEGKVTNARIAFGGMAGTPKRANLVETALIGKPWNRATVQTAMTVMTKDFTPLSDARASADYRMQTAQNMLLRYFHADQGTLTSIHEVQA